MRKKKLLVFLILLFILISLLAIFLVSSKKEMDKSKMRTKNINTLIATITYSKYKGIDAGEEHIYELYYKGNNTYRYDYKKNQITIKGPQDPEIKKGTIRNKNDLIKISKNYSKYDLNIIYYGENENINFSTIKELSKKLF